MKTATYPIKAGEYERGGSAASGLKELLKKIGVEAEILRRAMIAAYEAEMNVVIHSCGGQMQVTLDDQLIDVEVTDDGPGIPDVELAMKEGYSTAPPKARELGFGAGLGLPNIKKNSDLFELRSAAGQGTRLHFAIHLRAQVAVGRATNSLRVVTGRCRGDLDCVRACPTRALRIRGGGPVILEHLCIDCGVCLAACEAGALSADAPREVPRSSEDTALVVPPAFLAQFGPEAGPRRVLATLAEMGFGEVRVTAAWEEALRHAVVRFAAEEARKTPVISPVCPAVLNFIEMRFASLIDHVAPFLSPVEAAQRELGGPRLVVVASCPAQCTALRVSRPAGELHLVAPGGLFDAVASRVATESPISDLRFPIDNRQSAIGNRQSGSPLEVTGIRHVANVLEMLEDGLLTDARILELFACEGGCFGGPLLKVDPSVARWRWERAEASRETAVPRSRAEVLAKAVRRERRLAARPGLRLDADMAKAIAKLAQIDQLARSLPGRNCGMCGAPTCVAFAEDVVLGRAEKRACGHLAGSEENRP